MGSDPIISEKKDAVHAVMGNRLNLESTNGTREILLKRNNLKKMIKILFSFIS